MCAIKKGKEQKRNGLEKKGGEVGGGGGGRRGRGPIGQADPRTVRRARFLDLARRAAYGMQIIRNILFARIICRSGEGKKTRAAALVRVCLCVCVCVCMCTRLHAGNWHGRWPIHTHTHTGCVRTQPPRTRAAAQRRVVINFNKTLGVRRERAVDGETTRRRRG